MTTFTLQNSDPECTVNLPNNLSQDQLESFPAFKIWISTLQRSLSLQGNGSHEFHADPYKLRKIDVQSVDYFGGERLGFVKLKADVSNDNGEKLPGSVFLRGGSVAMLVRSHIEIVPTVYAADSYLGSLYCSQMMHLSVQKKTSMSL